MAKFGREKNVSSNIGVSDTDTNTGEAGTVAAPGAVDVPHNGESGEVAPGNVTAAGVASDGSVKKSIVPSKYNGRYKNGGDDALAQFIKSECTGKDGFEFSAFFQLCEKNGIDSSHVQPYRDAIANKAHGAQGRARMTLRNRLATVVRKNGALNRLNGETVQVSLPPLPTRAKAEQAAA